MTQAAESSAGRLALVVKRPKVYWRDSGLLHALLDVPDFEGLLAQPWAEAGWEGCVIRQVLGYLQALGISVDAYSFRTRDQQELDLVLEAAGGELWRWK